MQNMILPSIFACSPNIPILEWTLTLGFKTDWSVQSAKTVSIQLSIYISNCPMRLYTGVHRWF